MAIYIYHYQHCQVGSKDERGPGLIYIHIYRIYIHTHIPIHIIYICILREFRYGKYPQDPWQWSDLAYLVLISDITLSYLDSEHSFHEGGV